MTDAYSVKQLLDNRIAQTPPLADSSNRIPTTKFLGKFWVNVSEYGAVGDGVTDDTAAIANAITAAANQGWPVYLPAQIYLTDVITIPATLTRMCGASRGTTLKFKRRTYSGTVNLITIVGNTANFQLDTLSIDVGSTVFVNTQTILTATSNNLTIANLVLTGEAAKGIRITSGDNVIVRDVYFNGTNDGFAVCVQGDSTGGPTLTRMRVEDCRFTGILGYGCSISSGDGCAITNCRTNGNTGSVFGIALASCTSSIIANNHAVDTAHEAFQLTDCLHCEIIGNTCEWASLGTDFGISVNGTANQARFNLIANNTILNAFKAGIALADWSQYTIVANNSLRNCGVRGTSGGGSGAAITQLVAYTVTAAAVNTGNQFNNNRCVSESGTTTNGFIEINSGGGGSSVDNNLVEGNYFAGVTTIVTLVGSNSLYFDDVWRTYTPTVTAGSGTITSSTINSAAFRQRGKAIETQLDITITNPGTGAGNLVVTLPISAVTNGGALSGREVATTGFLVGGACSGSFVQLAYYNGSTVIGTGTEPVVSGIYRIT